MSPDEFWTDERISILVECVNNGSSASQAAVLCGCTRAAALGKAQRIGLAFVADITNGRLRAAPRGADEPKFQATTDPLRADKLLRKFSFETDPTVRGSK